MRSGKSTYTIVSARAMRRSITGHGPNPSMIHDSSEAQASSVWATSSSGARRHPGSHWTSSTSCTGIWRCSASTRARVDLPPPPLPMTAMRRTRPSSHGNESEARRPPANGGPRQRIARTAPLLLLAALGEYRVLRLLGDPELQHALRGDRDRLTGRGIASHASLAVDDHELPDAGDGEAATGLLVRECGQLIEELPHLLLGQTGLFRQPIQGLRLRDPSHVSLLCGLWPVWFAPHSARTHKSA